MEFHGRKPDEVPRMQEFSDEVGEVLQEGPNNGEI